MGQFTKEENVFITYPQIIQNPCDFLRQNTKKDILMLVTNQHCPLLTSIVRTQNHLAIEIST